LTGFEETSISIDLVYGGTLCTLTASDSHVEANGEEGWR
jgi:hypothetical protein